MKSPLNNYAFFFQGDSLLLAPNVGNSKINRGIPLEFADCFKNKEIFEIPDFNNPYDGTESQVLDSANTHSHNPLITVVSVEPGQPLPDGWRSVLVRNILFMLADSVKWEKSLVRMLKAFHIAQWRRESYYCGKCGRKNADASNGIARECPACGKLEFPRISPAIIAVIVNNDDEILLAHNKNFDSEMYSHIAGFTEVGETLEETVKREIREEINIEVKDIQYLKSQPWPFPNSLMISFYAHYASGTIQPDGVEIEDAKWFSKENMPELPHHGSLSRFLIDRWLIGELL